MVWDDGQILFKEKGHNGEITCILPFKNVILTAGSDGKLIQWQFVEQLKLVKEIINLKEFSLSSHVIVLLGK